MKKLLGIVIAVIAVLAMTVPAMAQTSVTTGVTVQSGTGVAPTVKAKWETTSTAANAESGDTAHSILGTQVAPNPGFQAQTNVWFWAVVTDNVGVGNIAHVYADVFYPGTAPVDPGPEGSLKFQVELTQVYTDQVAVDAFNLAYAAGLVTINTAAGITLADIREELLQEEANLYVGVFHFDNCQLAGNYPVTVDAVNGQNVHGTLNNVLQWLPLLGADWDFNAVNYGAVSVGVHKQIGGNRIWNSPDAPAPSPNPASIINTGNTYLKMTVKQDDMGFGKTVDAQGISRWNVHFDARLGDGSGSAGAYINYDPSVVAGGNLAGAAPNELNQILKLCAIEKVDFSILVDKDPSSGHQYAGLMILGVVQSAGPPTNGVAYIPPATLPTTP